MSNKLLEGFEKFVTEEYEGNDSVMQKLVEEGQSPEYFIISCIDSRANPGTIFKPKPGTFFAFKAMGAIVRPYKQGTALAASLQFALEYMKVPKLILIGHTQCGAIKALADGNDDPEIASFIDVAQLGLKRAKERMTDKGADVSDDLLREAEKQIVLQSMENLKSYPPVAKALEENRLEIRGWVFDMSAGAILEYAQAADKFEPITTLKPTQQGKCCA